MRGADLGGAKEGTLELYFTDPDGIPIQLQDVSYSKRNIYTTETYEGKRVQRFMYKGIGPVQKENQGVVWGPRDSSR